MARYEHDDKCSMCEVQLSPMEYDICDECRHKIGATEEDRFRQYDQKPEDGDWR